MLELRRNYIYCILDGPVGRTTNRQKQISKVIRKVKCGEAPEIEGVKRKRVTGEESEVAGTGLCDGVRGGSGAGGGGDCAEVVIKSLSKVMEDRHIRSGRYAV